MVEAQRHNVRVGLGTDVAGGYSPSLLVNCRHAVLSSKLLARKDASVEIDFKRAFWTATLGGARALGLEEHLGSFAVGKQFDACVIAGGCGVYEPAVLNARAQVQQASASSSSSSGKRKAAGADEADDPSLAAEFERWVNLGDDRNCRRVYVRGRVVHESDL